LSTDRFAERFLKRKTEMQFQIVELTASGVVPVMQGSEPVTFINGKDAANFARSLAIAKGGKYQPRPIKDMNWRDRERARFQNGSYQELPWAQQKWWRKSECAKNHFAHVSVKKPGLVAFTESDEKGSQDVQTSMKAGRYLTRFFADVLSEDQIRDYAHEFSVQFEDGVLLFAETADEIEWVYCNGPSSCMGNETQRKANGWGNFRSPFHPVRVYAAGDLQVAYIREGEKVISRALVWPEKKTHSRCYGDEYRIQQLLQQEGYRFAAPVGAKIERHVVNDQYFVAPYIDRGESSGGGSLCVADRETHLEIVISGQQCDQLYGLTRRYGIGDVISDDDDEDEEYDFHCNSCDEGSNGESYVVFTARNRERVWCQSCYENSTFYCDALERDFSSDSVTSYELETGETWSEFAFDDDGAECEATNTYWPVGDTVTLARGAVWSRHHLDRHGGQCLGCREYFSSDDLNEAGDNFACECDRAHQREILS
jgi:hypothetical protein